MSIARTREERIEKNMQSCVHFNGVFVNEKCLAGVNYKQLFGDDPGCFAHLTCLNDPEGPPCQVKRLTTREEAIAEEDEHDRRIENWKVARRACAEDAQKRGWGKGKGGGRSSLPCPVCKTGTLMYSIAGYNGHIHGKCTTEGCMSWME